MNINIEKISNGFILTLGDKRVFCDVPEAVCGELAQWALAECENPSDATAKVMSDLELRARYIGSTRRSIKTGGLTSTT